MTIDEVRAVLAGHRAELATLGVRSLRCFGSVARGEARPDSDVDFLVELERPGGLFKLARVRLALTDWLGCEVDLGTLSGMHDELRAEVLEEAVEAA